jgi:RNA binding exosome subunit
VPVLPRKEKDMDDVDKDAEDHVGDEVRYRVRFDKRSARTGVAKGLY